MLAFEYPFEQDGPLAYDWCSLASCFKDFKVIPSTARPSATRRSSILVWCSINMAAISGVWAIRKLLSGQRHDPEHCPGVSLFDWGVYAYDLGSFVFWWYEISAVARDPAAAAQISILNWIKTVGYLLLVNQHPISCQLHQHPRLKKSIFSAVLIIAVAQWIATCFAVGTQYDDILPTKRAPKLSAKYECLASRIEDAPGTTSCSADVLCSMSWMYSVADFLDEERSALFYAGILFICVSTLFPLFILVSFRDAMLDKQSFTIRRETILHVPRWLAGGLALYYVLGNIAIAILVLVDIQHKSASMDREAPLTYHLGCTALHLAFSPWRQYLDINDKGRALRVAKGWFNA
ncbi:uncharacterized protein F5Z01DRAFT_659135 [Emericellopsis atlantica]|uniref:Uncharacterized protein n=1 Tax=Emericellopsis atlantica TaxID=2614577 RepID=A0A9P7ZJH8_9HYPO|nr:uncharacterized protein F5Z01DRAFT_659135 [Emericellopsis atlantica]KAG9253091.1 hypothetical protein F5Z01DRAFT_659135 [Emericellopsis atlantica]